MTSESLSAVQQPQFAYFSALVRAAKGLASTGVLGAVFAHGHAGAGEEHLLHKGVGAVSALKDHCRNRKALAERRLDWKKRMISMCESISYFQTPCPNEYVFYFQSGAWGPSDYVILMGKEIK